MYSHDPHELISAYLDGEVSVEEREFVERMLSENADSKRLYDDLVALRSRLRSMPRRQLPTDFSQRVLDRIGTRSPSLSVPPIALTAGELGAHSSELSDPVSPASAVRQQRSTGKDRRSWHVYAWAAGATVAAALLVAASMGYLGGPVGSPSEQPGLSGGAAIASNAPNTPPTTGQGQAGNIELVDLQQKNVHSLVVDLTVSPAGRDGLIFQKSLGKYGIRFDESLQVAEELESKLLKSRILGDVLPRNAAPNGQDEPAPDEPQDRVELVYVETTAPQLDAMVLEWQQMPDIIRQLKYDLLITKGDQAILRDLHDASHSYLAAGAAPGETPSTAQRAFRLVWRMELRSAPSARLGMIGGPRLVPQMIPTANPMPVVAAKQPSPAAKKKQDAKTPPAPKQNRILFILRYPAQ